MNDKNKFLKYVKYFLLEENHYFNVTHYENF